MINKIAIGNDFKSRNSEMVSQVNQLINEWKTHKTKVLSDNVLKNIFHLIELNDTYSENYTEMNNDLHERKTSDERQKSKVIKKEKNIVYEEFLKQIKPIDKSVTNISQINFNDLKFSGLIKGKSVVLNELEIDEELYEYWINERYVECKQLANNLIQNFLKNKSENNECFKGKLCYIFFYNVVSQLIYFPLALRYRWNYIRFKKNLEKLCQLCYKVCDAFCSHSIKIIQNSNACEEDKLLIAVICFNSLSFMKNNNLRIDLIELLTETNTTYVLKLLKSTQINDKLKKLSVETNSEFDKPENVLICCQYIVKLSAEINALQLNLINVLSECIVQKFYFQTNQLMEKLANQVSKGLNYEEIVVSLHNKLKFVKENVCSKLTMKCLMISIKINVQNIISDQINHTFNAFNEITKQRKDENIILLNQLGVIFQALARIYRLIYDEITGYAILLKLKSEELFENYIQSEQFSSIIKVMKQI